MGRPWTLHTCRGDDGTLQLFKAALHGLMPHTLLQSEGVAATVQHMWLLMSDSKYAFKKTNALSVTNTTAAASELLSPYTTRTPVSNGW